MEYTNLRELYKILLPAFMVKKRLLRITKYRDITNEDIWKYLAANKWKSSINLTISDMVNDIILVDCDSIKKHKGGK